MIHIFFLTLVVSCFQNLEAMNGQGERPGVTTRSAARATSVSSNLASLRQSGDIVPNVAAPVPVYVDSPCGGWRCSSISKSPSLDSLGRRRVK